MKARPSREPDKSDRVGKELVKLKDRAELKKRYCSSMASYIAFWYQMRSSCYLRLSLKGEARREAWKGIRHRFSLKLGLFIVLSFLPSAVSDYLFCRGVKKKAKIRDSA